MHTLEDLESGALAAVHHVRLTHLGLTEFPRQLFALADTLEILDLSGNQLTALPDDLPRLHRLRILFASGNPFTTLPRVLGQCPQLEMVGFKACRITEVPADSLPPRLRWLILTDNQIEQLPPTLGQRPRLQKLMLSCNRLQTLPDLQQCHSLELLRIASNGFSAIPPALLQLPQLAWPALAGNPLTLKRELEVLDSLGQNPIFFQNLELHELLGEGASGQVWRATHRLAGNPPHPLAIKVFKAAATSDGTPQSELAAGLAAGAHPHLLTPLAPVLHHPQGKLAMALPLLPDGLQSLAAPPSFASCTRDVYAVNARWPRACALRMLEGIRSAVAHLHARGVVHGDLYAHNVLWNPSTGHAVLSDLGAAVLTQGLPAEQVQQLQAMEWRAFAHLQQEVLERCI